MKRARLIFGTTNALPVGTPDEEIERIYQDSYKPFLRAAYNAQTPVTLHYSGHLLQWLEKHHSEYTDVLAEIGRGRRAELLGGGFYNPVLSLIPRLDRIGQIESLTTYIRKRFGKRPRGIWITEHVWEPGLASTLRSSGMDYAFLDDHHFAAAGFTGADIYRPCITEDQGKTVLVFPVSHELVEVAREGYPEDVIDFIRAHASNDESQVFVLVDEGERYGKPGSDGGDEEASAWPQRMFELLAENSDWLETNLPAQCAKHPGPRRRAYFPSATRDEMLYRSLTRYGESNLMYAKMQYTHVLVNQIRGDKYRKQAAREELWQGQCHSAYWHGPHGGIYHNHLRKHVYRSLIEAEKITRERGIFIPSIVTVDFDMDGLPEYLYQGQAINAYIHQVGGHLFELDYLPVPWNYVDTMSRRHESCHTAEEKRRGYDRSLRKCFLDHFLDPNVTVEQFDQSEFRELGGFTDAVYTQTECKREGQLLALEAESSIIQNRRRLPLRMEKRFSFKKASVVAECTVENTSDAPVDAVYAPEFNFAFLSEENDHLRCTVTTSRRQDAAISTRRASHAAVKEMKLYDLSNGLAVILSLSDPAELWCMPVETVSAGPTGTETIYQGTCLVPRWTVVLEPGETFTRTLSIRIE
jgi:alpha-amylase